MAEVWIQRVTVSSQSEPDKKYVVARKADGTMGCSCPKWIFQGKPRHDCKHIEALLKNVPEWGMKEWQKRTAKEIAAAKIRRDQKIVNGFIFLLEEREFETVYTAPTLAGTGMDLALDDRD